MSQTNDSLQSQSLEDEIKDLERRLRDAKAQLSRESTEANHTTPLKPIIKSNGDVHSDTVLYCYRSNLFLGPLTINSHHYLLLLADSALPLGSFAFSSGLESYLAHTKPKSSFHTFLELSLSSYASTTLPFVFAAYRNPNELLDLDDLQDASIMCTVARRASIAQGRALLSIWDRSIRTSIPDGASQQVLDLLRQFSVLLRSTSSSTVASDFPVASAHLGPLFGAISNILGLSLQQTAYVFMLSHVKALLSAAVRASMFGPYHAQKLLASVDVQEGINRAVEKEWDTKVENAYQAVPVMDLWIGRHEMLYSRIFNS
jgi:urease accessory protein